MSNALARSNAPAQHRESYGSALERLLGHVALVAHAKRTTIDTRVTPRWSEGVNPLIHAVTLSNGTNEIVVHVDHESLIGDDEFFHDFVLPQIDAAIDQLCSESVASISPQRSNQARAERAKDRPPWHEKRVNVSEPWEMLYWCVIWRATDPEIRAAVTAVGEKADEVKRYLEGRRG